MNKNIEHNYVDLHLHSESSRNCGDSIEWYSSKDSINILLANSVKAAAFTDHDHFNFELYKEIMRNKEIVRNKEILFFPGVEMTIKRVNSKKGHIIFIFNNNLNLIDLEKLKNDIYEVHNKSGANLEKVMQAFKKYEFIMIPHVSKKNKIIFEDIEKYSNLIHYVEAKSNSKDFVAFAKKINKKIFPIMFSDSHYWNKYKRPNTILNGKINYESLKENIEEVENEQTY